MWPCGCEQLLQTKIPRVLLLELNRQSLSLVARAKEDRVCVLLKCGEVRTLYTCAFMHTFTIRFTQVHCAWSVVTFQ